MTKLYKLTSFKSMTHGGTQWGEGIVHQTSGKGELCGPGWLHAYEHPLLAALFNPIHANFEAPQLWLAEGEIRKRDGELKCGTTKLKTIRCIKLPELSVEFRVRFAIKIALHVYKAPAFVKWAADWLSGKNRSARAAAEAAAEAWAARAARAAARAAEAAARAAEAAARAAEAAAEEAAAEEAAWAARVAARAAEAAAEEAAWAARVAARAAEPFILKVALEVAQELNVECEL